MDYYKKIFGQQILNIKYENVVADIEKETRKILDFLDVDFEESCIKFYKNKRPIITTSVTQVRKPIYKNSINFWKNYKDFLKPLTNKLKESFKTNL